MHDEEVEAQVVGLTELLRILRDRWRWVAASVVVVTALALTLSLQQQAKYVASATILLRTVSSEDLASVDPNARVPYFADRQVSNEILVIASAAVQSAVEKAYDGPLDVDSVSASALAAGSDAVEIRATASDADEVARLVNVYAQTYIDYSRTSRLDGLLAARRELLDRAAAIDAQRAELVRPLDDLDAQLAEDPDPVVQQQRDALAADLQPEVDALDAQRASYLQQAENLQLSAGFAQVAGAKLLSEAEPADEPVSPKPLRDGVIGVMVGLGIGILLALTREFLDQTIRNPVDLERVVGGKLPILGVIPEAKVDVAALLAGRSSPSAEAYRALRTSVQFAQLDRPMGVVQVTSPSAGEGKTTIVANLAAALAQAGHRVTVACCDLRRPRVHNLLGVSVSPGLTDVVLGEQTLGDAVKAVNDRLFVLPAGTTPPNPSELLGSSRSERVLAAISEEVEHVVVDTPPVLAVTDPIVVSRYADATIVVVLAGRTTRQDLRKALVALEQAHAPVIGLVLNGATLTDRNSYGYDYAAPAARAADGGSKRSRRREAARSGSAPS